MPFLTNSQSHVLPHTHPTTDINGLDEAIQANAVVVSATAPTNPTPGKLWYNTTKWVFNIYDWSSWILVGPEITPITKTAYDALSNADKNDGRFYLITDNDWTIYVDWANVENKPNIPTAIADLTGTSDNITEGTSHLFMTVAERTKLGNQSWVNTWDQSASDFDIKDLADSTWKRASWDAKQDAISDLTTIRSNAALWATALQPWDNISDLINDANFITASVNNLTNYYTKTETYTKAEVDTLISNFWWFEVVENLPTENIKTNVIYLKGPIGTWWDQYEQWIYSNNEWVLIWETSVDLSNYFNTFTDTADSITAWSNNLFVTPTEKSTWNAKQNALVEWHWINIDSSNNTISVDVEDLDWFWLTTDSITNTLKVYTYDLAWDWISTDINDKLRVDVADIAWRWLTYNDNDLQVDSYSLAWDCLTVDNNYKLAINKPVLVGDIAWDWLSYDYDQLEVYPDDFVDTLNWLNVDNWNITINYSTLTNNLAWDWLTTDSTQSWYVLKVDAYALAWDWLTTDSNNNLAIDKATFLSSIAWDWLTFDSTQSWYILKVQASDIAWSGLSYDSNNNLTVDTNTIATQTDLSTWLATKQNTFYTKSATAPSNPNEGDQWYDESNNRVMFYNGTTWVPIDNNTTYTEGYGIDINNNEISVDTASVAAMIAWRGLALSSGWWLEIQPVGFVWNWLNISQTNNIQIDTNVVATQSDISTLSWRITDVEVDVTWIDGRLLNTELDVTQLQSSKQDKFFTNSSTAPANPSEGDQWYDSTANEMKFYDGSQWKKIDTDTDINAQWWNITGTLANQTDLQAALDDKQDILSAGMAIDIANNTIDVDAYELAGEWLIASNNQLEVHYAALASNLSWYWLTPNYGIDALEVNRETLASDMAWTWLSAIGWQLDVDSTVVALKSDLSNYYTTSQTYTKTEVDNLISSFWSFQVVTDLPSISTASEKVIYLKGPIGTWADRYEEWIVTWTANPWEKVWTKIWETSIDLSGYATTSAMNTALAWKQDTLTEWSYIDIVSNQISVDRSSLAGDMAWNFLTDSSWYLNVDTYRLAGNWLTSSGSYSTVADALNVDYDTVAGQLAWTWLTHLSTSSIDVDFNTVANTLAWNWLTANGWQLDVNWRTIFNWYTAPTGAEQWDIWSDGSTLYIYGVWDQSVLERIPLPTWVGNWIDIDNYWRVSIDTKDFAWTWLSVESSWAGMSVDFNTVAWALAGTWLTANNGQLNVSLSWRTIYVWSSAPSGSTAYDFWFDTQTDKLMYTNGSAWSEVNGTDVRVFNFYNNPADSSYESKIGELWDWLRTSSNHIALVMVNDETYTLTDYQFSSAYPYILTFSREQFPYIKQIEFRYYPTGGTNSATVTTINIASSLAGTWLTNDTTWTLWVNFYTVAWTLAWDWLYNDNWQLAVNWSALAWTWLTSDSDRLAVNFNTVASTLAWTWLTANNWVLNVTWWWSSVTVWPTAPTSPSTWDLWYDTTTTVKALKIYNGTAWQLVWPEIVALTQAQYDALPEAEKTNWKTYIITDASWTITVPWANVTDKPNLQSKTTIGSAAPATTPTEVWVFFLDSTNDKLYVSVWTSSSSDWLEVGSNSGGWNVIAMTQSEYNALTSAEKNDGKLRIITDAPTEDISVDWSNVANKQIELSTQTWNTLSSLKIWVWSQSDYEALATKDSSTLYFTTNVVSGS